MSEQTPEIQNEAGGEEPTMEDILASIRKIIADDDVTTALESPELDEPGLGGAPDLAAAADFDILDSLADKVEAEDVLDLGVEAAIEDEATSTNLLDELDFDLTSESTEGFVDLEIPDVEDEVVSISPDVPMTDTASPNEAMSELDDLLAEVDAEAASIPASQIDVADVDTDNSDDALNDLEGLLAAVEAESAVPQEVAIETQEVATEDIAVEPLESEVEDTVSEEDADLNLVKSLMADLTDSEETDAIDELENLDVTEPDLTEGLEATETDTEDNILDEILNMTIDEEMTANDLDEDLAVLGAEDIAEMEVQNIVENVAATDTPSLSEIAAAAEADANTPAGGMAAIVAAGTAVVAGAAATSSTADDDIREPDDIDRILEVVETIPEETSDPEPELDMAQEETHEMARTAKKDSIVEGATAAATADAFASLNQVVEDKAIKAERGDRIGDLVMEALQPMLKEWLDANLKGIVERAVTKEVKRISTGK